jgi:hypothetical protein
MERIDDKTDPPAAKCSVTDAAANEGWDPYDEYDCRLNEPTQTPAYLDATMPWLKDALAKLQAEMKAAAGPGAPETAAKKL